ncbi:TadE-like protein [Posidoniimonas polymericola]|uniref:TadE-like protein n=1 Tax=Posidoniimonas polymericola TaxID=2528002 RepID=A0A5C5ZD82_9BACT|nr:TadE family protein [Posidoniimonas polymericola]TWT85294.1 TadE-like protein [Posidoniimonas polymericola]
MHQRRPPQAARRGTTIVETAFVLPVFLFFIFALIEFGHAQMINNVLRSACREGARLGSTQGRSSADVENQVRQIIGSAMDPNDAQVFVKDGSSFDAGGAVPAEQSGFESLPDVNLGDAEPRQLFLVRAKIEYNDVALVPMPFMNGVVLQGQAFMRHE